VLNDTSETLRFTLDNDKGPPYHLAWIGYEISQTEPDRQGFGYSSHNSGHGPMSFHELKVGPGDSVELKVNLWGVEPADYRQLFKLEIREGRKRKLFTAPFGLCSFASGV
jgi:hypothetical protein